MVECVNHRMRAERAYRKSYLQDGRSQFNFVVGAS